MNLRSLTRTRVLAPILLVAALVAGGIVWATTASADVPDGAERDRVATAAERAAGGGTATDIERSDDRGVAYDVEVRQSDGREVDIDLDRDLNVVQDRDDEYDENDDNGTDDRGERADADDRPLTATERTDAEQAALKAVDGRVSDIDRSDDLGVAYEVSVVDAKGIEHNVELDESFALVRTSVDD